MKTIKILSVIILSLISTSCFLLCFTGCSCSCNKGEYEHTEESIITLSATQKTIFQDDTFVIKLIKDGIEVQAEWTTDDESVATVGTDGTVLGKAVGETKIRGTYEGKEYVCDLTVEFPTVVPTLSFQNSSVNIQINEDQTLVVKSTDSIPADAEYYAVDSTIVNVAKIAANKCVIRGLKIGRTEVFVSYLWKGLPIYASIDVFVRSDVEIVLNKAQAEVDALTITTSTYDFSNETALSVVNMYKSGSEISVTGIEWRSENTDVATVDESGNVMGKSAGETYIVAEWIDPADATNIAQAYCKVKVNLCAVEDTAKQIRKEDDNITFEIIDLTLFGIQATQPVIKDITDVKAAVTLSATQSGNTITLTDKSKIIGGERRYSVEYGNVIGVNIDVEVCDKKIETSADLKLFSENVGDYKLVKLFNNIDLDGEFIGEDMTDLITVFDGIFDGQGFTIYKGIYKGNGLFTNLSENSVVKNVAFKGATLYSYEYCSEETSLGGRTVNHKNTSIMAYKVKGAIDNVLIDVNVQPIVRWANGAFTNARFASVIGAVTATTTNVSNVVAYWRVLSPLYYVSGIGLASAQANTGTMHVLINNEISSKQGNYSNIVVFRNTTSRASDTVDGITSDVYYYKDDSDLTSCAAAELSSKGFNGYWCFDFDKAAFESSVLLTISTAEQLIAFSKNPSAYPLVKLTADIDLTTEFIGEDTINTTTYFSGEFDGQGHTIYNGVYKGNGLFTNLSATSVVKNVAFKGAKLYSYEHTSTDITVGGRTVNHRNTSIIAYNVKGTIDNVLIDVNVLPIVRYVNNGWTDARFGTAIGAVTTSTTNISNVIVYWRVLSSVYGTNLNYAGTNIGTMHVLINTEISSKQGNYSNVVVFRNTTSRASDTVDGITADVYNYQSDDNVITTCAAADLANKGFNAYWDFSGSKAVMVA